VARKFHKDEPKSEQLGLLAAPAPAASELQLLANQAVVLAENELMHGYRIIQGTEGLRLQVKQCLEHLHAHFNDNTVDAREAAKQSCLGFAALALIWSSQLQDGPALIEVLELISGEIPQP